MVDPQQLRLLPPAPAADAPALHPSTGRRATRRSLSSFGEVMTVEEAAQVLRISRSSAYELTRVWRATKRSGLPVIELGRRLVVPTSVLEEILDRPGRLYLERAAAADTE